MKGSSTCRYIIAMCPKLQADRVAAASPNENHPIISPCSTCMFNCPAAAGMFLECSQYR